MNGYRQFRNLLIGGSLLATAGFAQAVEPDNDTVRTQVGAFTFSVVEYGVTDIGVDIGAPGDSLGDSLVFVNPVYDATDTVQVGENRGMCSLIEVGASYYCMFTVTLVEGDFTGSLALQGPLFVDGRPSSFVITGATGTFTGFPGEMNLTFRDNEAGFAKSNFQFVFANR